MAKTPKKPEPSGKSSALRFEATLGAAPRAKALQAAAALALDRLPDVDRKVRLLISPDDARRLLESGYEVHLLAAVPVAPLRDSLILSDKDAQQWLDKQLKSVAPKGAR
jgi:hypothetical protein